MRQHMVAAAIEADVIIKELQAAAKEQKET